MHRSPPLKKPVQLGSYLPGLELWPCSFTMKISTLIIPSNVRSTQIIYVCEQTWLPEVTVVMNGIQSKGAIDAPCSWEGGRWGPESQPGVKPRLPDFQIQVERLKK